MVIFYYLIKTGLLDLNKVMLLFQRPEVTIGLLLVMLIPVAGFNVLRWQLLLRTLEFRVPFRRVYAISSISLFFATFLPGTVASDPLKMLYLVRQSPGASKSKLGASLIVDRVMGLSGMLFLPIVAWLIRPELFSSPAMQSLLFMVLALSIGVAGFLGWVVLHIPEHRDPFIKLCRALPLSNFTLKVYRAFKSYQGHYKVFLLAFVYSLLLHLSMIFIYLVLTLGLVTDVFSSVALLMIVPLGELAVALPVAPVGIGVGHAAFESLYSIAQIPSGANVFNLYTVLRIISSLSGGFVYFFYRSRGEGRKMLEDLSEVSEMEKILH